MRNLGPALSAVKVAEGGSRRGRAAGAGGPWAAAVARGGSGTISWMLHTHSSRLRPKILTSQSACWPLTYDSVSSTATPIFDLTYIK